MKKAIVLCFLSVLFWASNPKAQLYNLTGDVHTSSSTDSIGLMFQMLSTDAKLDTTADSVCLLRYRVDGSAKLVVVDHFQLTSSDTLRPANHNLLGFFAKTIRASDGSSTIGHYIVRAIGWKGATLRQMGFVGYDVVDASTANTRLPRFAGNLEQFRTIVPGVMSGTGADTLIHSSTEQWLHSATQPNALVSGRVDASVGAMATDVLTAGALAGTAAKEIQDTLRKVPNNSSFFPNLDFELSDVTGANNTPAGWTETGASSLEYLSTRSKQGRFAFNPSDGQYRSSDSVYIGEAHKLYFGAWLRATTTTWTLAPIVRVSRGATGVVTLALPAEANSWTWRDTTIILRTAGRYRIDISGDGDAAESLWVDDIHFTSAPIEDTSSIATATWTNGIITQANRTSGTVTTATNLTTASAGAISAGSFVAGAIDATAIATDAIGAAEIAADAIGASEIAASAINVSEAPNLDAAITTRLAPTTAGRTLDINPTFNAAIDWGAIDNQATSVNLSATTVGTIGPAGIASSSFATSAIDATAIAPDAIGASEIAANAIGSSEIATGAITNTKFAVGAIDSAAIAPAAIDSTAFTLKAMQKQATVDADTNWKSVTTDRQGVAGSFGNAAMVSASTSQGWGQTGAGASAVIIDGDNLIRNGHFEQSGAGALNVVGWTEIDAAENYQVVTNRFASGQKALFASGNANDGVLGDSIFLKAGTNIAYGAKFFVSNTSAALIDLIDVTGTTVSRAQPTLQSNRWGSTTGSFRVAAGTNYRIKLILTGTAAGDSGYADDVWLKAFPDTLGSATTSQAVFPGSNIDTVFTRNMTTGNPIPNVLILVKTLAGASIGQITTGATGKVAVNFQTTTHLLYPLFTGGVTWRSTDNPDTFNVTGSGLTDTIRADAFSPTSPPGPSMCTVFGTITGKNGLRLRFGKVSFTLQGDTTKSGTIIIGSKVFETYTDTLGMFQLPVFINSLLTPTGSTYSVSVAETEEGAALLTRERIIVPNQASWELTF